MIYGQDEPVALPTVDLYDSGMMQMALNAAKEQYIQARDEQKEFLKLYGDFYSPFAKDNDYWYSHTTEPVLRLMQEAASQGLDLTRSPEGRALLTSTLRNIPYGKLAELKAAAKQGEQYLKNQAELQRAGKYSPELERWDLERQGLPSFEDWDTATMGPWKRISPITYQTLHDFVAPIVDNTKPGELSQAEVEGFGLKYDPKYQWTGVSKEMLKNPIIRNIPGLIGNPIYDFYYDRARRDIIAEKGDPTYQPSNDEILNRFLQNAVDSVPEYLVRPTRDADKFAVLAQQDAYDRAADARKFAHEEKMARMRAAGSGRGRGGSGGGYGDDGYYNVFRAAELQEAHGTGYKFASYKPYQYQYHRLQPANPSAKVYYDQKSNHTVYVLQPDQIKNKEKSGLYARNDVYNEERATSGIRPLRIARVNYSAKYAFVPDGSVRARKTYNGGYRYFAGGDVIEQTTDEKGNNHNRYVARNCTMEVKEDVDNYGDKVRK